MGWSYRKSVSFGPFRINLSKSGVGYSVGGRGFRTGVKASGRRYTSVGIPGTGVHYYKSGSKSSTGCAVVLAALAVFTGGAVCCLAVILAVRL